jgi:L-threonylcarbamoyladenylate synthase
MIFESTGLELEKPENTLRVSGALENHYAPKARVVVGDTSIVGAGFLALEEIATPEGMIRLASPKTVDEYGRVFYQSLRKADHRNLETIVIAPPEGDGLAIAIRDRIEKARTK